MIEHIEKRSAVELQWQKKLALLYEEQTESIERMAKAAKIVKAYRETSTDTDSKDSQKSTKFSKKVATEKDLANYKGDVSISRVAKYFIDDEIQRLPVKSKSAVLNNAMRKAKEIIGRPVKMIRSVYSQFQERCYKEKHLRKLANIVLNEYNALVDDYEEDSD